MSTLVIIPARGCSKRIPNKNKRAFCGKPLVWWAVRNSLDAEVGPVVVSSDDDEILDIARDLGAHAVTRPKELATDTATSEAAVEHVLSHNWDDVYAVAMVQATTPGTTSQHIRNCVEARRDIWDAAMTVRVSHEHCWSEDGGAMTLCSTGLRTRAPTFLVETGGVYVARPSNGLWRRTASSHEKQRFVIVDGAAEIDIDTEDDWRRAENACRALFTDRHWPAYSSEIDTLMLDFDGVLGDNRVWTDSNGNESVCCSKEDTAGIIMACNAGLRVHVLTHEENRCVRHRCAKLGIECSVTQEPKESILRELCDPARTCYVGNDVADVEAMKLCCVAMCPNDSSPLVKAIASMVLSHNGGQGAVREAIEVLLRSRNGQTT